MAAGTSRRGQLSQSSPVPCFCSYGSVFGSKCSASAHQKGFVLSSKCSLLRPQSTVFSAQSTFSDRLVFTAVFGVSFFEIGCWSWSVWIETAPQCIGSLTHCCLPSLFCSKCTGM